mmetsp:Transcript_3220/g.6092  ORF Transcript_3220/g.6092 Transcript_3220/m.6092 type:complete len:90 (+) Transcript_3220:1673-1942(+)
MKSDRRQKMASRQQPNTLKQRRRGDGSSMGGQCSSGGTSHAIFRGNIVSGHFMVRKKDDRYDASLKFCGRSSQSRTGQSSHSVSQSMLH